MNTATLTQRAAGTARLMFYSLLAISLMALDYRGQYLERLRNTATQLTEPLLLAVDLPAAGVEQLGELVRSRTEAARTIERLEQELVAARAELGLLVDLDLENRRLRQLLGTSERVGSEFLSAEIGAVDLDPFAHRLMLRRGRSDGVDSGMPVVDAEGVLGQVDEVGQWSSRIVLITDPDHALPVQILPSGERTIAYGSGAPDRLRLTDLPMNTAIETGDLVVTSGIGGRFPPGLPVARIAGLAREPGQLFARAEAVPLAAMGRNRVVMLLQLAAPAAESEAPAENGAIAGSDQEPSSDAAAEDEAVPPDEANGEGDR